MKYLVDLTPSELEELIDTQSSITLKEKIDGNFIAFGLDDQGRFYTSRYPGERYFHQDEWPDMPWTNSFRAAHTAISMMAEHLAQENLLAPGQEYEAEIVFGHMPNTIRYSDTEHLVILHKTPNPGSFDLYECEVYENTPTWTLDAMRVGGKLVKHTVQRKWMLIPPQVLNVSTHNRRTNLINKLSHHMIWLDRPSHLKPFTHREILELKLNKRPENIEPELWSLKMTKDFIKNVREEVRSKNAELLQTYAEQFYEFNVKESGFNTAVDAPATEGLVVSNGNITFKVLDPGFKRANRFTHLVRYIMLGGQRPAKSSFLSRTAGWTPGDRIDRLYAVWERYMDWRIEASDNYALRYQNFTKGYNEPELHERTMLMFAELEQRIRDGWDSV